MKSLRTGVRLSRLQRGLTLVELMIALLIGLFLMGGLATLLMNTKSTFLTQSKLANLQDDQRMAMTMISDAVQQGGYYPNPAVNVPGIVPTPFSGTESASAPGDTISVTFRTADHDDILNCSGTQNTTGVENNYVNKFSVDSANSQLVCDLQVVGTAGTTRYELVSGVKELQILYGVRRNATAPCRNCVDTYLTATDMLAGDWNNVIAVAITLKFGNPLYTDGTDGQPLTVDFRRVVSVMSKAGVYL
jgi:type IV pilus assembly protein PilW